MSGKMRLSLFGVFYVVLVFVEGCTQDSSWERYIAAGKQAFEQGEYAEAEPLFKRALAISEKALGPEHPDVATCLENLAALYRTAKLAKEAKTLEQRAARIRALQRWN